LALAPASASAPVLAPAPSPAPVPHLSRPLLPEDEDARLSKR
jgi:hypothetical protein